MQSCNDVRTPDARSSKRLEQARRWRRPAPPRARRNARRAVAMLPPGDRTRTPQAAAAATSDEQRPGRHRRLNSIATSTATSTGTPPRRAGAKRHWRTAATARSSRPKPETARDACGADGAVGAHDDLHQHVARRRWRGALLRVRRLDLAQQARRLDAAARPIWAAAEAAGPRRRPAPAASSWTVAAVASAAGAVHAGAGARDRASPVASISPFCRSMAAATGASGAAQRLDGNGLRLRRGRAAPSPCRAPRPPRHFVPCRLEHSGSRPRHPLATTPAAAARTRLDEKHEMGRRHRGGRRRRRASPSAPGPEVTIAT